MNELHADNCLLEGLEIIELGEGLASSLCGRILVDLGARVVKIEPPQGDWLRRFEPRHEDVSLAHRHCSMGKEIVTTRSEVEYQNAVTAATATADAVFDHPQSHQDPTSLAWLRSREDLVLCDIHDGAFGETTRLGENGIQATTGLCGYLGSVEDSPRSVRADVASLAVASFAAQAILAALFARERTGVRTVVDVSATRSIASIKSLTWAAQHCPDAWTGFHCNAETGPVQVPYRAADGPISFDLGAVSMPAYDLLEGELGLDIDMTDLTPSDIAGFGDDATRYRDAINAAIGTMSAHDVGLAVQRARGISVPYTQLSHIPDVAQVQCLKPFHTTTDSVGVAVKTPIRSACATAPVESGRHTSSEPLDSAGAGGPLAGVKVIDLGIAGVGPWGATLLAYLGADVVKIESPSGDMIQQVEPDQNGRRTTYAALNLGKRVRVLDLKTADGLAALESAIRESDVITENFRPGVMARFGLTPADIVALNPRIVTFSSTGYGTEGPFTERRATDGHIQALSGFAAANGRGSTPEVLRYNGFLDLLTSTMNAVAMIAGLVHSARTGNGTTVSNTMLGTALFAEQVAMASALAGAEEPTNLSERAEYAPAGAYRTKDGWVALDVRNDHEWAALQSVLEPHGNSAAPIEFVTNAERTANRDLLRRWIEDRTRRLPTRAWTLMFHRSGVPGAAYIRDAENLCRAEAGDISLITSTRGDGHDPLFVGASPWAFAAFGCPVPPPPQAYETDEDTVGVLR
ncbi:hypothetical protein CH306_28335 [Rhodococcus sp. 15-725-2-2b]|uniref:CaiB/BaiF CoA-transferase family protein n=1 Tax=unclassified Rhodococcus (in: high G+C Gram-positive bacteria) TaxID=192944 RepID=UPI000B9AB706|nr:MULTISPECIES: CoA transferase [unclassified Rhodococcus (in: high G+C Gram-positive bacteria)]OZC63039.1 hypothetical protein CH277_24345 [Rhodococcus sp. 06-469-3-2]OZD41439.1 hypothetical protein CH264_23415 [Rhodococcus sp. 06-1477-1A]OZE06937.1 hypothetical protein CH249_20060 [Rhodococcus sp. 05-2255-3B1]OZE12765.1 hypothetical protein CH255_26110 [Rhodococcus sp. 05-2255-2A2]OZE16941.1 hypothetical protein CH250_00660 [Rhodococcus sp. 05-2255-3C]